MIGFCVAQDVEAQATGAIQGIRMVEVMPSNGSTVSDEHGDFSDWIEITNLDEAPINLAGYGLSPDFERPFLYQFPSYPLNPGERLVIFCSGRDSSSPIRLRNPSAIKPMMDGEFLHLDASRSEQLVLREDGSVMFWLDQSPAGRNALQLDADRSPVYTRIAPDQIPAVYFDGINDFLSFPELVNARTVFWVGAEHPFASNDFRPILGHTKAISMTRGADQHLLHYLYAAQWLKKGVHLNSMPISAPIEPAPIAPSLLRFEAEFTPSINLLGADRFLDNQYWHGWFSELILYNRLLTDEEIKTMEQYLMDRWGLPTSYLHAPFKIPNEAGILVLTRPDGVRMDAFTVKPTPTDVTLVRDLESGMIGYSDQPTPGKKNQGPIFEKRLEPVVASIPAGSFTDPITIQLSHADREAVIRYTLDGDIPDEGSLIYTDPIPLSQTTVMKARAFSENALPSESVVYTYLFDFQTKIPVVSMSGPPDEWFDEREGIYVEGPHAHPDPPHKGANYWLALEREIDLEWMEPDGTRRFHQKVGAKIHGGWSRTAPQKSVALIARGRYGEDLFHGKLFDDLEWDAFKQLVLRNSGNDWHLTMLRDVVGQALMSNLDLDTQAYRPVHVLLNGAYMGMHNLRERPNEHFLSVHSGLPTGQIDLVDNSFSSLSGDHLAALAFVRWVFSQNPLSSEYEQELEKRMDVDNFFDYVIAQVCIDNQDWPDNNVRFWKERDDAARWRWMPFDLDGSFDQLNTGMQLNTLGKMLLMGDFVAPKVMISITRNTALLKRFILRFQHRLNNVFTVQNVLNTLEEKANAIRGEMPRHMERWKGEEIAEVPFPTNLDEWNDNLNVMRKFAIQRPAAVWGHLAELFGFEAPVDIQINLPPETSGRLLVDGLPLIRQQGDTWSGKFFKEYSVTFVAESAPGYAFLGWAELGDASPELTIRPAELRTLTPVFEHVGQIAPVGEEGDLRISEIMYHPSSHRPHEEYIEIYNADDHPVQLLGWQLDRGVEFEFPEYQLLPGAYVVVAADRDAFLAAYPRAPAPLGPWKGRLSNNGENIRLSNHLGKRVDEVRYADEGEWGQRQRGPLQNGFRGWVWSDAHDGGGHSLEKMHLTSDGDAGQNWGASISPGGSPGYQNSLHKNMIAPFVSKVQHRPAVPRSDQPVWVSARLEGNGGVIVSASVHYRSSTVPHLFEATMLDQGQGQDLKLGDGIFGAAIPAHRNGSVVEFYITVTDNRGLTRTWPKPAKEGQVANALFQVDDHALQSDDPVIRIVTTDEERNKMATIGRLPWNVSTDAQMNATFIVQEKGESEIRYLSGVRIRGTTSRSLNPKNRRVHFPNDDPWRNQSSVVFNAINVPSQVLGSALFQFGGVPASRSRPVIFIENNVNHASAGFPQFGRYAQMEALGGDFADEHFDGDGNGNLYRPFGYGNLEYIDDHPASYQQFGFYEKSTNEEEDDWTDLIHLTRTLAESTDELYEQEVELVAHTEEWLRYFAMDTLLGNMETSFANGGAGDYALYFGEKDPRATLLPYDLDSLLGMAVGGFQMPIFRATANQVPDRFLKSPGFAQRYYRLLQHFADTLFAPDSMQQVLGNVLGDWTDPAFIDRLFQFTQERRAFVLGQIPRSLTVQLNLPQAEPDYLRYYQSDAPLLALSGRADVLHTQRVLVQGREANWSVWEGQWSIADVPLHAGVNEIVIRALDASGEVLEQSRLRVFHPSSEAGPYGGVLEQDTVWDDANGPIQVASDLIIPVGVELQIRAGTSVEFLDGAGITVRGALKVQGTADARVYFSAQRFAAQRWGGLKFEQSMEDNELSHVTLEWTISPGIHLDRSKLDATGLRYIGAYNSFIVSLYSTLSVRDSIFPDVTNGEPIAGIGIPDDGYWIIEGNEFGKTTGYADVIDFTGGKRPGPVAQFLNNRFHGGADDGLDLDGGDAFVAGNVFMNFQKDNVSSSESHAIATGLYDGETSNITVVRNVFYHNDHDLLLKEGATAHVAHNTFVDATVGTISLRELERRTQPPTALYMEGNIIRSDKVFHAYEEIIAAHPEFQLEINHSMLPEPWVSHGTGNLNLEPVFRDETTLDFRLAPQAGVHEIGPLNLEPGAYVAPGLAFTGLPEFPVPPSSIQIHLGGPGVVAYRYQLDQGDWSEALPIETPLDLPPLADGEHQLAFIEKDAAGNWRHDRTPIRSRVWQVDSQASPIRLNEIYANPFVSNENRGFHSEFIEVVHTGDRVHLMDDYSLTDDPALPAKFMFPSIAVASPGQHLVVGGQGEYSVLAWELPFGLKDSGEGVYLFRKVQDRYELVDAITFGWQAEGWSIGRDHVGEWRLSKPTPGEPNQKNFAFAAPGSIRLNEWTPLAWGDYRQGFIELANTARLPVALSGWTLGSMPHAFEGVMTFPPLSFIAPGQFMVLEPGDGAGDLPQRLDKESDLWALLDTDATVIDQFWYANPIEGLSYHYADDRRTSWVQGAPTVGTHNGGVEVELALVINEIAADNRQFQNANSNFADWVEILNLSPNPLSLKGVSLTDDVETSAKWVFPDNAVIEAHGTFVVWLDGQTPADEVNAGFSLKSGGDELWLFGPRSQGGVLLDYVSFGIQIPGYSLGRHPDSLDWGLTHLTPILPNIMASLGALESLSINEWMADPSAGSDWFELYNASELPLALDGVRVSDDPSDLSKHVFPPLSFIGTQSDAYLHVEANGNQGKARESDFKLSADGESILLSDVALQIIDRVDFGPQNEGVSQGRWPDGSDQIFDFVLSGSPGAPNRLDKDLDGLPDLWEVSYGFNPDSNADALLDPDQDRSSNQHEYQANTDPLDAESVFSIQGLEWDSGAWRFWFLAMEGRGYQVQTTQGIGEAWDTVWEVDPLLEDRQIEVTLPGERVLGYLRLKTFQ